MGCLALLILGFLFRGVIFAVLGGLLSLIIGALALLLKLGIGGFIVFALVALLIGAVASD